MIQIKFSDLSREPGGTLRILNDVTPSSSPLPRCALQFGAGSFYQGAFSFFPPMLYLPAPSATAPVCACACVLTVTRCYICSCALSPYRVKLWASAFGGEIKSIAAKYSGSQLLQKVRFLWWQEAMIFSSTENGGRFSFPNKRKPRAASVIRDVSDPPVSWQCTVPVTSLYQPVIFRWHSILNTKKSRILSGTVLAEARKLSVFCMALLSVSVLLFQCESRCSSGQKMLTSCKGQHQCLCYDGFHLAHAAGWGSVYQGKTLHYCLSSLQLYNPIIPQSSRPRASMHYIITDKENECGYLSTQLHCWVITYERSPQT